ncbi:hypothetical protein RAC89_15415 [Paenibacillus sp. GD4]|uniref:hypothetical protein n=1 Tax=Paenibacillus sp. GD4 TaxID=3068890 RepID=UPI00279671AB|nr:hypothetical protein [Paenibacillus sp. GD4]MDQ1911791.1 hypothetical protein [Paenibacillus sp. GD4]
MEQQQGKPIRYPKMHLSVFTLNHLSVRNPFVVMWWSAAIPGYGHMILGKYGQGFVLVVWEFFNNYNGKLNYAIYYSMIGDFTLAKQVLHQSWIILYVAVYVFTLWDSYMKTLDMNKLAQLCGHQFDLQPPMVIKAHGINYLRVYKPWLALLYSSFMPGLGHIYLQRLISGVFIIVFWVLTCYYSHFPEAVHMTMIGDFTGAKSVLNPEWLLFMPSLYVYGMYESYDSAKHFNHLYRMNQAEFLRKNYQHREFRMPI